MLRIECIVVEQTAQPRFGQQQRVCTPFAEPPHAGVDRAANRDGQDIRPVVKE